MFLMSLKYPLKSSSFLCGDTVSNAMWSKQSRVPNHLPLIPDLAKKAGVGLVLWWCGVF